MTQPKGTTLRFFIILLLATLLTPKLLLAASSAPPLAKSNDQGYALGWEIGLLVKSNHHFINFDKVTSGFTDSLKGNQSQLSKERMDTLSTELEKQSLHTYEEQKVVHDQQIINEQKPGSNDDDLGYALGWKLGQTVKARHPFINLEKVALGLSDSMHGKAPEIPQERISALAKELSEQNRIPPEELEKQYIEQRNAQAATNEREGKSFLGKNKLAKGVITTDSGLQYIILRKGTGPIPKNNDYVSIDYRGTTLDGREFDSTYKTGRHYDGFVDKMMRGWSELLQLMPVGSKYRVFLPPELAYGDEGYGPIIAPKATLIYEIELMTIHKNPPTNDASTLNQLFSQLDLRDMTHAAGSFLKLYTSVSPQYTKKELTTICQTISTESFQGSCIDIFAKRLTSLQGMLNLKRATFSDKKIVPTDTEQKTVLVSWQQQLTLADSQTITTLESMFLQYSTVNSLWKISKISTE